MLYYNKCFTFVGVKLKTDIMKRLKQICKDLLQVVFAYLLMSAINWDWNIGNWGWFGRIIFILLVAVLLITNDKNK